MIVRALYICVLVQVLLNRTVEFNVVFVYVSEIAEIKIYAVRISDT